MKKKLLFMILFVVSICICFGCSTSKISDKDTEHTTLKTENERTNINIGCMKGPTAIGMIHLLSESDVGNTENHYAYTISGTADELSAKLINQTLDVAAVPCNMASILNQKTNGEIVTVAINTLGVLYIVENGTTIESVADLKGKTIYSTGQGTTPEYTLRYLLNKANLDPDKDVTIEYKSEATEVVASMAQNAEAVAMLPQPYVTIAINNNPNLHIALDITKEWEKLCENTIVTGVLVARKSFIEENTEAFQKFLKEYEISANFANSNIETTANLLEQYDVFKLAIAKKAIPYCNVTYLDGNEMKNYVLGYLQVLYEQNPDSVGGTMLTEEMFYVGENTN